ncbi:MAG: tetratricopeptide repeat protein [Candidatus Azobacteroides sp.]|nr:tetratricopeptide repeat protein [Candidatus Azobacteroides sp.]
MKSPELLNGETLPQLKSLVDEYPYFQTVRMLYLKNLQIENDLSFPMELRKMAFYAVDRKKLYYWIEKDKFKALNFDALDRKENIETFHSFSIIDTFLSTKNDRDDELQLGRTVESVASIDYLSLLPETELNNRQDVQPLKHQEAIDDFLRKDKQSPVKIKLEESNLVQTIPQPEEKTEFLGETLAKIYIKQKKYEKALQIIQKLSLQYPEKNAYFALQIEELEKLITNNK